MWLITTYRPTAFFSLRKSASTDAAGRTLPVPSPYAIKMGFVDAAFRAKGSDGARTARTLFEWVKGAAIAFKPPPRLITNGVIIRVLQSRGKDGLLKHNIAYREFVHFDGDISFAWGVADKRARDLVAEIAPLVNYFGKRAGFFQLAVEPASLSEPDPKTFILPFANDAKYIPSDHINVHLDDTGPDADFDRVNIFSGLNLIKGVDRVDKLYVLPYRIVTTGKGYSVYERV